MQKYIMTMADTLSHFLESTTNDVDGYVYLRTMHFLDDQAMAGILAVMTNVPGDPAPLDVLSLFFDGCYPLSDVRNVPSSYAILRMLRGEMWPGYDRQMKGALWLMHKYSSLIGTTVDQSPQTLAGTYLDRVSLIKAYKIVLCERAKKHNQEAKDMNSAMSRDILSPDDIRDIWLS